MSAQRSIVSSPRHVCCSSTDVARRLEAVRRPARQQGHVAAPDAHVAHLLADRVAVDGDRSLLAGGRQRRRQLDEAHRDVAVHAQHRLVVVARPPSRRALGADRLEHVLLVLADGDLLVRRRHPGDLEDVGEGVVLGVVVDDLDRALAVAVERTEDRRVLHRAPPGSSP